MGNRQQDEQGNPIDPDTGEVLSSVTLINSRTGYCTRVGLTIDKFMVIVLYNKMGDLIHYWYYYGYGCHCNWREFRFIHRLELYQGIFKYSWTNCYGSKYGLL